MSALMALILVVAARLCVYASSPELIRPIHRLTPGAILKVNVDQISASGYTRKVRLVPWSTKKRVFAEYGIAVQDSRSYEIDHLVPLELGGSNGMKNLWPESNDSSPWNAHLKDRLENKMHALVCSGQVSLPTAQHDIATDWIAAYKKYMKRATHRSGASWLSSPHSLHSFSNRHQNLAVRVWVNSESGVYHLPGDRWYGKTADGTFMTEKSAILHGFREAKSRHR